MRAAVVLVVVALLGAAGYYWWVRDPGWPPVGRDAKSGELSQHPLAISNLPSEAVLSIKPGLHTRGVAPAASKASPALLEYSKARSNKAIYDRLIGKADRTPEEEWMLAAILQQCTTTKEEKQRFPDTRRRWVRGGSESRDGLAASISEHEPNRTKRLEAFDQVNGDHCEGLHDLEVTETQVKALLERGAAGGDPKARAALISHEVRAFYLASRGDKAAGEMLPTLSAAQLSTLKEVLASGDPEATTSALSLMSIPFANFSLRTGTTQMALDTPAWQAAAMLAGCELGYDCGPAHRTLLEACAMRGQCGANDLREHYFYYGQSPASSQMVGDYLEGVRRARTGDWSYFTVHNGPPPNVAAYRKR